MTSCAGANPRINPAISHPEAARFEPEAMPAVPAATVACAEDPSRQCVTDADSANFIRGVVGALDRANRKLCWLAAFHGLPACPAEAE